MACASGERTAATPSPSDAPPAWRSDNGDGTYTNPPLFADYPDPDIIRVGEDFYFATTTFVNVPGLTILHSRDLVSWEFATHVIPRLDGRPQYDLIGGAAYRSGVYAPSLRHHDGVFYVAVTPVGQNTRIYSATDIRGPWTFVELDRGAFDPGLFFDADGKGYIATSAGSDGTVTLLTLSDDYRRIVDAREIFFNEGAEGSKLLRRGDYYYMFHSIPRRLGMTVSRARSLSGPWETREQIDDTTGGHQGAIVDLPDGADYGFVMLDAGAIGRVTNISPIFWEDGWPVWGTPSAPGRVPAVAAKPITDEPALQLAASDDFTSGELGLQWQWNHNPDDALWSLSERPGFLRLRPTRADGLWLARNTLTQKGQGPKSRGVARLDVSHLQAGDVCGLGTLGKHSGQLAVNGGSDGGRFLSVMVLEDTADGVITDVRVEAQPFRGDTIYLRAQLDFTTEVAELAYSEDGAHWTELGGAVPLAYDWRTGTFQGPQFALFCYNADASEGHLDVDWFRVDGWEWAWRVSR